MSEMLGKAAEILELANLDDAHSGRAPNVLESGGVVYLADAGFELSTRERRLLDDASVMLPTKKERESRNGRPTVTFEPDRGQFVNTRIKQPARAELQSILSRYADWADRAIGQLFPDYATGLKRDRITYRPCRRAEQQGMHVDSIYGRPTGGRGMLRVFCNIDPNGAPRVWRIGEGFETFAARYLPSAKVKPVGIEERILSGLNLIKGRRTLYDHVMADIRGQAKADARFQAESPQRTVEFPAGSAWIAITDLVLHGAVSGQHSLDQMFFLPPASMRRPEQSSLRLLERLMSRPLA